MRVTNTFKFNRYCLTDFEDHDFVFDLYSTITTSRSLERGEMNKRAREIEEYLNQSESNYREIVRRMSKFIQYEHITHYIQAIDMGAASYYKCTQKQNNLSGGGGAGITVPQAASLEAKVQALSKSGVRVVKQDDLGILDGHTVKQEATVNYDIMPIDTLLDPDYKKTREALQEAIREYIEEKNDGKSQYSTGHGPALTRQRPAFLTCVGLDISKTSYQVKKLMLY